MIVETVSHKGIKKMQHHSLARTLLVCVCVIAHLSIQAQVDGSDSLRVQFNRYAASTFTEKIYVHTDRNFYVAGEIVWFKSYLMDEASNKHGELSKVAYVDIIDNNNRPYLQAKVALKKGSGNGSIYLPVNIPSGSYKIRAYTNWMKNFDAEYFFEKPLTIVNTLAAGGLPAPDTAKAYDIQFFPEGGSFVKDNECKIAFRMTDQTGKGIDNYAGIITDNERDTLIQFAPYKFGIGYFVMKPASGHHYQARITTTTGEVIIKDLPSVDEIGYSMRLLPAGQGRVAIEVSTQGVNPGPVYLFVHTRGVLKDMQRRELQNNKAFFSIPDTLPGEGISQFTVFNSYNRPACERLYFREPSNKLSISATPAEKIVGTRKKVSIDINSADSKQQGIAADMSVAVYRLDSLQAKDAADIYSYLWLNADLKGAIDSSSWYFASKNDSTRAGLDNLMLTHGWRRFRWQDVQENNIPLFSFLPEYEGHIITGKITDTATRKPYPGALVYISFPGERTQFYAARSDAEGNLRYYTRDAYGPGELVVQAEGFSNLSYNVDINTPFAEKFSSRKIPDLRLSEKLKQPLELAGLNVQIQRKYAAELMRQYRFPDIDTSAFYGKPDERYLLDDYTRFTTMEEVLREYVLGVVVGRSGGKFKLTSLDLPNNRLFKDNPLVLLDGVPVSDMDKIMSYDPLKVRKMELVKRRYYYGPIMVDGILNMTTYKGNLDAFQMDPKAIILDYEGLQLQREFYSPVYETVQQARNRLADFRNLLYWSPDIMSSRNGRSQISFYTGDVKGSYIGIIQGMTPTGVAGTGSCMFDVQ